MAVSKWVLDPAHSEVNFSVRHMMISRVNGTFHKFDANLELDPEDLTTAKVEFTVDLASVDTRNADRDNHLRSPDFFDVENHPKMTFTSTSIEKVGDKEYKVTGDLTIRGKTLPQTFTVTVEGLAKNPFTGIESAGFIAKGEIDRKDYGLVWNFALEGGGVLVGEKVNVEVVVEATREQ